MPKYLITGTIYGQFEKVEECANENDAYLRANEMAPWYTNTEYDIQELHEGDEDF